MSVLDLGSGVGDVAFLAAELVGPEGHVVGIDRDPVTTEIARGRAASQGLAESVTFHVTDLLDFVPEQTFDAVIGRYVLLFQPEAAAVLRHFTRFARPGASFVFHEVDATNAQPSCPPCPEWDDAYALMGPAFRASGAQPDFGRRLSSSFQDAGLPTPTVEADIPIATSPDSPVLDWIARTLGSIAPLVERLGLSLPSGIGYDELAAVWRESIVSTGTQIHGPVQYGAWARLA